MVRSKRKKIDTVTDIIALCLGVALIISGATALTTDRFAAGSCMMVGIFVSMKALILLTNGREYE